MKKKLNLAIEILQDTPEKFQQACHKSGMKDLDIIVTCEELKEKIEKIEKHICHQYVGKIKEVQND
ncbi:MAG: hypothetical protein V1768_01765 [Patescibacteria group bacterium]